MKKSIYKNNFVKNLANYSKLKYANIGVKLGVSAQQVSLWAKSPKINTKVLELAIQEFEAHDLVEALKGHFEYYDEN